MGTKVFRHNRRVIIAALLLAVAWCSGAWAGGAPYVISPDLASTPGNNASSPEYLTTAGDKVFFIATDPLAGTELWVTDGTEEGTFMVRDIGPGRNGGNVIDDFEVMGERLFFVASLDSTGDHCCPNVFTATYHRLLFYSPLRPLCDLSI